MHIAAFITSHGFGHAGRMSAVLDALHARRPEVVVDVFTEVPAGFLDSSLVAPHRWISCRTDVGMVQQGPFQSDLHATATVVTAFLDGLDAAADAAAERLRAAGCTVALCDISPLGIVAAARAGIPAVLIENFRWDWIYAEVDDAPPLLRTAGRRMAEIFRSAALHLQVEPMCDRMPGAEQIAVPVARGARVSREAARKALGLHEDETMVLVTTGGVTGEQGFIDALHARPDVRFVVTGAPRSGTEGNVTRIANRDPLYLPDVIRASDGVVAKLGYSTLAEVWREGRPFLRVPRSQWPEGPALSAWAAAHMPGFATDERTFESGRWVDRINELVALPSHPAQERAGQDRIAERVAQLLPTTRSSSSTSASP